MCSKRQPSTSVRQAEPTEYNTCLLGKVREGLDLVSELFQEPFSTGWRIASVSVGYVVASRGSMIRFCRTVNSLSAFSIVMPFICKFVW